MTAGENKVSEIGAIVFVYKHSLLLFVVLLFRFRLCVCLPFRTFPCSPVSVSVSGHWPLTIVRFSPQWKKKTFALSSLGILCKRQTDGMVPLCIPLVNTCGGGDGDGGVRVVVAVQCYCYTHAVGQKGKKRTLLSLVGFSPSRRTARVIPVRKLGLGKRKKKDPW